MNPPGTPDRAVNRRRAAGIYLQGAVGAAERKAVCVTKTGVRRGVLTGLFVIGYAVRGLAQTAPPAPTPDALPVFRVTIVELAPLPGINVPAVELAAPVQTADTAALRRSGSVDLADLMNRQFASVHVNETQGNPFQPDFNFRGYTASPLLGAPQGLSVYMDGVRLNQPFGEVVSWDLIPRAAIASTTFMPGSNPLFGLNTLGGAVTVQTKDGRSAPGTSMQAIYGSDVRRAVEFEHGGARSSGLHWYLSGNLFAEDGWREASPSTVRQLFGKIGRHRDRGDIALSVSHADNVLNGNGLQELRLIALDRGQRVHPARREREPVHLPESHGHPASDDADDLVG